MCFQGNISDFPMKIFDLGLESFYLHIFFLYGFFAFFSIFLVFFNYFFLHHFLSFNFCFCFFQLDCQILIFCMNVINFPFEIKTHVWRPGRSNIPQRIILNMIVGRIFALLIELNPFLLDFVKLLLVLIPLINKLFLNYCQSFAELNVFFFEAPIFIL